MDHQILLTFLFLFGFAFGGITTINPFLNVDFFVNPDFVASVQTTIDQNPNQRALLERVKIYSVAYWVDRISKVPNVTQVLNNAKAQQVRTGKKVLSVIVVYDLPNRDCAAAASGGEIACADNNCVQGLNTYKTQYIDPLVSIFRQFPDMTIVALVEPDSLPNLATNLGIAKCSQAAIAYKQGIAYAVQQLATIPNVAIYLDSAHGGWLGYSANLPKIATIFSEVLGLAGGQDKIRGFATNTANYQALGSMSSTADPCGLKAQGNAGYDEVHYVNALNSALVTAGITNKGFIIDTSRNGVPAARADCSNWCNIRGAGLGARPSADTTSLGLSILDAVYWSKVPGESDGTSDSTAQRYDAKCSSQDSIIPAPEAGKWFSSYFISLCQNAQPALASIAQTSNGQTSNGQQNTAAQTSNGQNSALSSNQAQTGDTIPSDGQVSNAKNIAVQFVLLILCFVMIIL